MTVRLCAHFAGVALLAAAPALAEKSAPLPADLPPFGADRPLPVAEIVESRLANGLTVWIVPRPGLPKLTAVLAVRGGTALDSAGREGLAEVLATVVRAGTAKRTSREIAEEVQAAGGEIRSFATDDATLLTVSGLAGAADRLLDVLADVAGAATFPDAEVELEKANALQGLAAQEANPEFAVDKAFAAAVFGDHPYGTVAPTEGGLAAITPAALREEYARRFRPERSLLVVAGAVDAGATGATAERLFAGWRGHGPVPAPVPPAPATAESRLLLVARPGAVQSELRVGRPMPRVTDPDYFPLVVANTIYGGSFGSRLVENIREEKGYTYSPGSGVQPRAEGSLFAVEAAVRNEVTAAALLEIFYELDRMGATLPSDEELRRAKRFQTGIYLLRNQVQATLATTLAHYWVRGQPPRALAEFVPRIEAVTAEQVRAASSEYFASRLQTVVVGGAVEAIAPTLEVFGPATVITP